MYFTLSQWEIFWWGLIYIDETLRRHKRKMASKRKMSIVNKDLSCGYSDGTHIPLHPIRF